MSGKQAPQKKLASQQEAVLGLAAVGEIEDYPVTPT